MKFKVRWMPVNNADAEITWEPFKSLRATIALHSYLNAHKMRALIPPQYKLLNN